MGPLHYVRGKTFNFSNLLHLNRLMIHGPPEVAAGQAAGLIHPLAVLRWVVSRRAVSIVELHNLIETQCKNSSTGIRTQDTTFKVSGDNHFTMEEL